MPEESPSRGFWHTVPGILTGVAAVVTAGTGLALALQQLGLFERAGRASGDVARPAGREVADASVSAPAAANSAAVRPVGDAPQSSSATDQAVNLLAAEHGTQLVTAAGDAWLATIDPAIITAAGPDDARLSCYSGVQWR